MIAVPAYRPEFPSGERPGIGIVGCGQIVRNAHLPAYAAYGCEVVGVYDVRAEATRGLDVRVFKTLDELLADPRVGIVDVATHPAERVELVRRALGAGKHVLTQGRMAIDLDEAKQMLAAARARPQLVTQVVPAPYTFAVDRAIQQQVLDGYLGDLLAVDMRVSTPAFLNRDAPIHWRQDRTLSGLNVMAMGIWYESLLRWTGGVTSVMAQARTFVPVRRDAETGAPRAATVPEHVEVIGEMAGGGAFHLQISSVTGLTSPAEVWLFGSEGTLKYEQATGTLLGGRRGEKALTPIEIPEEQRYRWRVEEEFVNAIRGEEQITRTSFVDGVRYMAYTEAVARSAAEGRSVPVLV